MRKAEDSTGYIENNFIGYIIFDTDYFKMGSDFCFHHPGFYNTGNIFLNKILNLFFCFQNLVCKKFLLFKDKKEKKTIA